VPGLRLPFGCAVGKVGRAAAVGQVVSVPDTSPHVYAADSGRELSGTHRLRRPAADSRCSWPGLMGAQGASLPRESPSSSGLTRSVRRWPGPVPV